MWSLDDGRCLQSNCNVGNGITFIKVTTSGRYLLCGGNSNFIYILDASTLNLIKKVSPFSNWISNIQIIPTGKEFINPNIKN